MSGFLSVCNNGAESFKSKYNGIEYEFAPKSKIIISTDAARHIFGVGVADKTEVLTRHGWLNHSSHTASAMEKLNSFSFSVPNNDPDNEPIVELAQLGAPSVVEDDTGQGSAPLQSGTSSESVQLNGEAEELDEPIIKGGTILDDIPTFLKR